MTNDELVTEIKAGNSALYATLWDQLEKYVYMMAGKHIQACSRAGLEVADLVQIGYLALVDAVNRYQEDRAGNTSFLTLYNYVLRDHFNGAAGYRTAKGRGEPLNGALSLDEERPGEDDSYTLGELVADPVDHIENYIDAEDLRALHDALEKALADLPEREAAALRLRYYEGKTLHECGAILCDHWYNVRDWEKRGLKRIRKNAHKYHLEERVDLRTNFYMHGQRPVEKIVLHREHLRNILNQ